MRASKFLHRILKIINYANLFKINEKCYFSVISWPILILFVLSDRAWCGLQNFYTEFWNSLIMHIYSKSMKNATSLSFLGLFWFCLFYLIGLGAGFKTSTQNFLNFINYANLCKFIQNQWKMLLCHFLSILILFVLSDRAWCGLQNFYTEFWNSLIMQIYANLFKINEKCYFSVISWPILILFGLSDRAWWGLQNFYTEFWNSLIMQIYAYLGLFKINEKCYFSISQRILILFVLSDRAWWGLRNFYTELKSSFPKRVKSTFDENWVSNIIVQNYVRASYRVNFRSR